MFHSLRAALLPVLLCLSVPAASAAPLTYTDLIAFGDSLTRDRFSNGPGWASQLGATSSGSGGTNYAEGGAFALDMRFRADFSDQRRAFAAADPMLGDDPLAVVWLGVNDLLSWEDPASVAAAVTEGAVRVALASSVSRVVLVAMPDLGTFPYSVRAGIEAQATAASTAFNAALRSFVDRPSHPEFEFFYADIEGLFTDLLARPGDFGFTNAADDCDYGTAEECEGFVFLDGIHVTTGVQGLIADRILDAQRTASPVPLPAGGALLIAGLGALTAMRLRAGIKRGS